MKVVFMIMPFEDAYLQVYRGLREAFSGEFDFSNASDEGNPHNILHDIVNPIFEADFIIADLSGLNSNVMYELGLAHSFMKKTIIITQDELGSLPFDIKQYRVYKYGTHFSEFNKLVEHIRAMILGSETGDIVFSNPVNDFLMSRGINISNYHSDSSILEDEIDSSEKGLLDYMADIEAHSQAFLSEITIMSEGIGKAGIKIQTVSREMDEISSSNTYGRANRMKQSARKLAGILIAFGDSLSEHVLMVDKDWKPIEDSFWGLLDNKHATSERNKEALCSLLNSLDSMRTALQENIDGAKSFDSALKNVEGLAGNLSKATKKLKADIVSYRNCYSDIVLAIDRIMMKGEELA